MTTQTFVYGEKSYPVIKRDGKEFADFGEKGLKLLKRNSAGELVKGFPGREPGTSNSTTSSAKGNSKASLAPDTGIWAQVRNLAEKRLKVSRDCVTVTLTPKTVTVEVAKRVVSDDLFSMDFIQPVCTWSANKDNWLNGNGGIMSASPTVQSSGGLSAIAGYAEMLDNLPMGKETK